MSGEILTSKDISNLIEYMNSKRPSEFNKIPINKADEKILRKYGRFNENVYVVMKPFDINIFKIGDDI